MTAEAREGAAGAGGKGVRISLTGVSKVHASHGRKVTAVDGIDLVVEPGELLVLLGPSGCGKSTLLDLLAGLEAPTAGAIRFDGKAVADPGNGILLSPKERNVSMVFQSYALYPHLTVGENIAFPLRVGGADAASIPAAVRSAAAAVQLESLLEARPSGLSGGQRQRVAIARALVRAPSLFLMDEPLSNLDARLRSAMRGRIKSLQRELGVTTVYVTHDQQEAMALGDRVAVLKQGRIEQIGKPAELFAQPASAFVARFAGLPPMNLLRVRSAAGSGGPRLESVAGGRLPDLPPALADAVPAGDTFLLGFRPEHASLAAAGSGLGLPVRVDAVEPYGRDVLVHLSAGTASMAVLVPAGSGPSAGEAAEVCIDAGKVRLFPDDGEEP